MTFVRRHPLWCLAAIAAAGLAVRFFLAFHWYGNGDIFTFAILGGRMEKDPLHVYATNIPPGKVLWPYPPGYLFWLVVARDISLDYKEPFENVVHLLPILADMCIAIAVYVYLGWRGASIGQRVAGFALVAMGPAFMAISGYHGQLDAVATLPGVLAFLIWERRPEPMRSIEAGVLLGVGGVLKTVPLLLIVPLLASVRSVKEAARLIGAAVGVAVLTCLPFYLSEPEGFRQGVEYTGVPSRGGLSLVFDPGFAADRRLNAGLALGGDPNGFSTWISRAGGPITLIVLAALGVFLYRYRPATIDGIVLLWLAIFALSPNFLLQYLVWALPYFIMAGYLKETALLQLGVIPALVITYLNFDTMTETLATIYVIAMFCLWIFWVVALVNVALRIIRARDSHPGGLLPPVVGLRPAAAGAAE